MKGSETKIVENERLTKEQLLTKTKEAVQLALAYHPFYERKAKVMPKCAIRTRALQAGHTSKTK